ncbi:MAG: fluoride efflux transporter CrcB [Rhodospirillaceae bacterium]|jgi:fluoride exporter|nr:fluoride efflux transporter CrcB [Rhodospirillaceae bacterium]
MNWTVLAAVAAGGAVGSAARYIVTVLIQRTFGTGFPWWTMSVNVTGSFIMGVIVTSIALRWSVGQVGQAFLMIGILGGFTTFSAFSLDVATLVERNATAAAGGYVLTSVLLSIGALFGGIALTRAVLV